MNIVFTQVDRNRRSHVFLGSFKRVRFVFRRRQTQDEASSSPRQAAPIPLHVYPVLASGSKYSVTSWVLQDLE